MTKRKASPLPKGGQPGNRNAAKEVTLVTATVALRPDQLAALDAQLVNRSKAVRDAIDTYLILMHDLEPKQLDRKPIDKGNDSPPKLPIT